MKLNTYIDHTALKPTATKKDIETLCLEAKTHHFASVCINASYVPYAAALLKDTDVKVCTVIGFPLGATATEVKAFETGYAYENGCDEFDMVIHIGALKSRDYDYVKKDIRAVVEAANGKCVKVIIETGLLTDAEKDIAVKLSCEAGASFVKTCTGFSEGVATPEDIRRMKKAVSRGVKVKASAGIRTYDAAKELVEAGADRIGASASLAIINGSEK